MSQQLEQFAENYAKNLEARHNGDLRTCREDARCAADLGAYFIDSREQINAAIRDLFKQKVIEIAASDASNEEKASQAKALNNKIDYMKSINGIAAWYINVELLDELDELEQLTQLTPIEVDLEALKNWPTIAEFHASLVDEFGEDNTPNYQIIVNYISSKKDELQKKYEEKEGMSPAQALLKSREYKLSHQHKVYISPEAQEDLRHFVKQLRESKSSFKSMLESGAKTLEELAQELGCGKGTIIQRINAIREEAETADKNPDDYAQQFTNFPGKPWLVTKLGQDGDENAQGVINFKSELQKQYDSAIEDGAKTAEELVQELGYSRATIIQRINAIREEAETADKNPDDYAQQFTNLSGRPWLVTKLGQDGDDSVRGIRKYRLQETNTNTPTPETSQHLPSAVASSPASSAPEAHRASPLK